MTDPVKSNFAMPHYGNIPLTCVRPSATNPRKHFGDIDLAELAASIRSHGVAQPILVRPLPTTATDIDCVEIVAGERRYRASKLAGLESIPAIVREMTDVEALEIQVVENLQRKDVHPIEEAEGYEQLMKKHGYTADQLADKVGKSRAYIYGRLKLCALGEVPRAAFFDGKLTPSTALLIARIPGITLQVSATKEITSGYGGTPLPYRQALQHVRNRYMLDMTEAPFDIDDAKLVKSAGACHGCPKRSSCSPLLFPDITDADVCTDPECFATKRAAHNDRLLANAKKKHITIYSGKEINTVVNDPNLIEATAPLWKMEREAPGAVHYKKIESLLAADQLPEPSGYIKEADKVVAVFDRTALQLALEKAGVCETVEQEAARLASAQSEAKITQPNPAVLAAQQKRAAQELVAKQETVVRVAIYTQVRAAGVGLAALRIILHSQIREYQLPYDVLSGIYGPDMRNDGDVHKYIDTATVAELQLLLMDTAVFGALEISCYDVHDGRIDAEPGSEILFDLADANNIGADKIRAELTPAPEPAGNAPATAEKKSKPKNPKKTEVDPRLAAWPFPTASELEAAKNTGGEA